MSAFSTLLAIDQPGQGSIRADTSRVPLGDDLAVVNDDDGMRAPQARRIRLLECSDRRSAEPLAGAAAVSERQVRQAGRCSSAGTEPRRRGLSRQ